MIIMQVVTTYPVVNKHNGSSVWAQIDFTVPGQDVPYSYVFRGTMDCDGRGYSRYRKPGLGAHPFPLTVLDPGKIPLHLIGPPNNGKQLANGGILAADGTQTTILAQFWMPLRSIKPVERRGFPVIDSGCAHNAGEVLANGGGLATLLFRFRPH